MADLLLVVANAGTPTAGDLYYQGIIEELGHTVTLRSDEDADSVVGFDGVVVAESCSSATLSTKYSTAAVPVVTHEAGHVNGLGMTNVAGNSNEVLSTSVVLEDTHPMMDGPYGSATGTITILSSAVSLAYIDDNTATLSAGVTAIAASPTNVTDWFTALAGEGGSLPDLRAFLWPSTAASSTIVTGDGEITLKNTYFWLFGLAVDTGLAWVTA